MFFAGANNGSFLTRFNRAHRRAEGGRRRIRASSPARTRRRSSSAGSGRIRSSSRPSIRTSSTPPRSTSGRRPTAARRGTEISGDLTRHDPKTMQDSGGPITHDMNSPEIYATVFSLAPGKTDVNVIWAGSDDGLVHVTRDGGKTWTNVTPKDMPDLGRVSQIDASAFDAGTAYIAVKKPLLADFAPYIFRTHDFGRTWTKIVDRHRGERLHARRARGSGAARACSTPARSTASTSRSTTATAGSRCRTACRTRQVSDIWVEGQRHRDRDARPRLLRARRRRAAAAVRRAGHVGDRRVSLQAGRCDRGRRTRRASLTG